MLRARFQPSRRDVHVPAGTTLLEAARPAGLPVASACGADGICGRCGMKILDGSVPAESESETRVKQSNRVDPQLRLSCRVELVADVEASAPYWGRADDMQEGESPA